MTPEQQTVLEGIGTQFVAAAPQTGWDHLRIDVSMIHDIGGFAANAVSSEGVEESFFIDDAADKRILAQLHKLREQMASQSDGRGAWFIMSLTIPRDTNPFVDFDYETKPKFGVDVNDAMFKKDIAMHPRDAQYYPAWLGGQGSGRRTEKSSDARDNGNESVRPNEHDTRS